MTDIEVLARRIDRLESRNAIAELVSRYAIACDEQSIAALRELFTEDATLDSPSKRMVAEGREAICEFFTRTLATRGPSCHWTHDLIVRADPDDPDRATGVVYCHAETTPEAVVSMAALRYTDEYRRVDGQWRFRRREVAYLYYVPVTEYPTALGEPLRVHAGGTVVAADYPETLPSWRAFKARQGGG
jgi:uncharacterized protein (TIGR02246 family)